MGRKWETNMNSWQSEIKLFGNLRVICVLQKEWTLGGLAFIY